MPLSTPLTPHHNLTLVEDVLLSIFWHLEELKGTLKSAGLVCRAWYNPAMDVLWANSINLLHLLNVLSQINKETIHLQHFVQPLTLHSWSRFHSLAHRVRDATLSDYLLKSALVSELSRTNPKRGPLLPNVRRLVLCEERNQHSLIWMGPAVENLCLLLETRGDRGPSSEVHGPPVISDFFTHVGALCPNLTDLTLKGQGISADSIAITPQTIGQLHRLKNVDFSNHDEHDVSAIVLRMAELPALESLSLVRLVSFPSKWPQSTTTPFPKLKKLLIKRPSHAGTRAFLHNLASTGSHLTELELGEDFNGDIASLKEMMVSAGEHTGLESLVMYSKQDRMPLFIDTLEPILQCRSLSTLKLDLEWPVGLKDDDMETLASSFPKMEHLALATCHNDPLPSLTLRTLSIAVTQCPCLETLSIVVDACKPVPQVQHVHAPHNRLRELNIGCSPVERYSDVAYFMAGLSDAEDFCILSHGRWEWHWDKVTDALPAMRKKRAADRARGLRS
ncbi:hypothetical protein FRB96_003350 [Tulasnella sp. 330]|nr:hypothetical protein FRB96_003350 [Tulasnella sp. 330]